MTRQTRPEIPDAVLSKTAKFGALDGFRRKLENIPNAQIEAIKETTAKPDALVFP
jgi:predicted RNA polymerase sigma factor